MAEPIEKISHPLFQRRSETKTIPEGAAYFFKDNIVFVTPGPALWVILSACQGTGLWATDNYSFNGSPPLSRPEILTPKEAKKTAIPLNRAEINFLIENPQIEANQEQQPLPILAQTIIQRLIAAVCRSDRYAERLGFQLIKPIFNTKKECLGGLSKKDSDPSPLYFAHLCCEVLKQSIGKIVQEEGFLFLLTTSSPEELAVTRAIEENQPLPSHVDSPPRAKGYGKIETRVINLSDKKSLHRPKKK